ncbi:hypothetical protein EC844_11624 [Acinetobacter calcoaceticus]|uniref:Uncharacterized protein n=1 Tax=Acinetobacter calcoaceticus TaxID=471 RepID=A0A4R1XPV7_ACICA|nr:hypothetical protein EC844_11624 [Acinetobacter calcoaceticus]
MNANDFIAPVIFLIIFGIFNIIRKILSKTTKIKEPRNIFWYLFILCWGIAYLPFWKSIIPYPI